MKVISAILIVIILAGITSTIITVIPNDSAIKVNRIGYKSICPFSPYSTLISAAIAIIAFLIGKQFIWR